MRTKATRTRLLSALTASSLILPPAVAFHGRIARNARQNVVLRDSKLTNGASYSDDWLLGFHNKAQDEKQLVTNSLALWNEEQQREQQNILEWQESFQRNGYADFTPPMSAGLNCLMVGGDIDTAYQQQQEPTKTPQTEQIFSPNKLPWEQEAEADITSLRVISSSDNNGQGGELTKSASNDASVDTVLVSMPSGTNTEASAAAASTKLRVGGKKAAVYDCIVDHGLMGSVLSNEETVKELLSEAAISLREYGIYVLVTHTLPDETRELLEELSIEAGFQWEFELDVISDDTQVVSVARRFCIGKMPAVGKLSRFQP